MLKKLTKDHLHKKFKRLFDNIIGVNEQQAAMAMKAYQVNINGLMYYVGRAQVSDIDEILDIERAVYNGATPWNKQAFISELHRKHDRLYLVIRKDDQLIAFIGSSYSRGTKDMHITNIAVLPGWQCRGIGSFLLNVIIDKARQINACQVSLEVRVSNTKAHKVYSELGFESQGISAGYYFGDHEDALKMALLLSEDKN
ncbi:ribosomal protein S18-alanine N-acetyltransferase [Periweissella fabalis]|uniref:Ribosomal protein S18-alanine N-acetyltransferase n=1 Tax=Periweissella fabalis TaxID=1070421 RepID=A0A7X6N279_9LACO|nr:ribosomal protein S18-alanine N-acetyltransferase [Periweissella fabalis]MCM0598705.1 ribosomal protein S18-alanine N-acetyltransferase [Periweissella fabalis]NKZ24358.1 ribosomal protein S18-alanine N-acetyltransferase [Periweissella fabalis]